MERIMVAIVRFSYVRGATNKPILIILRKGVREQIVHLEVECRGSIV